MDVPFCDTFAYFGQNLVAIATSIRPLQSEMSSLDCSTTKNPVISNHILVSPKIGCSGNAPLSLVYGSVTVEFPDIVNPV